MSAADLEAAPDRRQVKAWDLVTTRQQPETAQGTIDTFKPHSCRGCGGMTRKQFVKMAGFKMLAEAADDSVIEIFESIYLSKTLFTITP